MSTYQLGFIGTGNMGGALAQAAAKSGAGMLLSNRTADKAVRLAAELGCAVSSRRSSTGGRPAAQPGRIWRSQKAANTSFSASSRRCSRRCWQS